MNVCSFIGKKKRSSAKSAKSLCVAGIRRSPMTPTPDDAELAAYALLSNLCGDVAKDKVVPRKIPQKGTEEYFRHIADNIQQAHKEDKTKTLRVVAFCEQQLQQSKLPEGGNGSLQHLSTLLYGCLDTAEREGGELKRRWQHCLAEVTVMQMQYTE